MIKAFLFGSFLAYTMYHHKQHQILLWTCVANANLQRVNNHYAKFEYKGMKHV